MGDEISSIMVTGKSCEYDGLDLVELLSEEFEVSAPSCFVCVGCACGRRTAFCHTALCASACL